MRLEQMEYLLAISKTGSMNAASENLHITHQSLNRSIKNLENELDTTLLNRTAKGVTLTPHGKRVLEAAEVVFETIDQLLVDLADTTPKKAEILGGTLDIIATPVASSILFPDFSTAYSNRYPNVNLSIKEASPIATLEALLHHNCDFSIANLASKEVIKYQDQVDFHILMEDTAIVVTNRNCPLAQNKSLSIKTLLAYPFVLYSSSNDSEHWLFPVIKQFGTLKRYIFTNSQPFFFDSLIKGPHITLFSQAHWGVLSDTIKKDLVAIPLRNKKEREHFSSTIALLTLKGQPLTKPAQAFVSMMTV